MYKDKVLHSRDHFRNSDVRFEERCNSFDYSDMLSGEISHMREIQLLDKSAWVRFVEVYRQYGIDDSNQGWRCEYWGKMMRGACFTYKCSPTPDDELYAVLEGTVRDMLTVQDNLGRFSTYSVEGEFHGWDIWGRKYIMLGFMYFLDICRDETLTDAVIAAVCRHADYMMSKIGRKEDGKLLLAECTGAWDGLNSCSILEPFMMLYNITGERKYFDFAEYIVSFGGTLSTNLFETAYEDKTMIKDYSVTKAYEMISCFEGLAEYVKVTKNEHYRDAVIRFANRVLKEEDTIIGCLGCDYENFNHSVVDQFNEENNEIVQETCVTVTWMKFMWQLWRMTGDAKYIDSLELSAYNAMSASVRRHIDREANGGLIIPIHSYNPLRHSTRSEIVGGRQYIEDGVFYGCCVCISTAGFALDTLASAGHDNDGTVYVNLYRNGSFTSCGMTVHMDTDYPNSGKIQFKVDGDGKLAVRVPGYAEYATLTTNGSTQKVLPGYAFIDTASCREFTLDIPMEIKFIHPADVADIPVDVDVDYYVAVSRGPVTYAYDETFDKEPVCPIDEEKPAMYNAETELSCPCNSSVTVMLKNGTPLTLVDYSSAGQEAGHKVCAWIRTR